VQLLLAGTRAVYGIVVIGPRLTAGWVYVVTAPSAPVYTPGKSWFSESQDSKVPLRALLGAL
jgi:hypothetical protein